ncbi:MAG: methyltransferase [Pseudomonadota bacterium]
MRETRLLLTICAATGLAVGCGEAPEPPPAPAEPAADAVAAAPQPEAPSLTDILAAQDDATKARFAFRHPAETLDFFGIEPGMRVMEALPGGGWYSKILVPYLGSDGELIGVNYEQSIWPLFGFFSEERLEELKTWTTDWPASTADWGVSGASVSAYEFGAIPTEADGTVDAFLMIRALHNMARFQADGDFLTTAAADAFRVLKPGGVLGVVQHRAPDSMPDEAAGGDHGYLRRDAVVEAMSAAGFELVAESEINANPNDVPAAGDIVWRLPPTYNGTDRDDAEAMAALDAIGESDRMTLKFAKPE